MVTYRGYQLLGSAGDYRVIDGPANYGPFAHYSDCQTFIDALPAKPRQDVGPFVALYEDLQTGYFEIN